MSAKQPRPVAPWSTNPEPPPEPPSENAIEANADGTLSIPWEWCRWTKLSDKLPEKIRLVNIVEPIGGAK